MTSIVSAMKLLSELLALSLVSCLSTVLGFMAAAPLGYFWAEAVWVLAVVISASATWAVSRPLGLWRRGWIVKCLVLTIGVVIPAVGYWHAVRIV